MKLVYVLITNGPLKGNKYVVKTDSPILVGRSRTAAIKVHHDELASRKHALIYWRDGTCYIDDLDSTNGTYVNDQRVNGSRKLANGDILCIGETEMALFVQDMPEMEF